jgi:hypothetical protein
MAPFRYFRKRAVAQVVHFVIKKKGVAINIATAPSSYHQWGGGDGVGCYHRYLSNAKATIPAPAEKDIDRHALAVDSQPTLHSNPGPNPPHLQRECQVAHYSERMQLGKTRQDRLTCHIAGYSGIG